MGNVSRVLIALLPSLLLSVLLISCGKDKTVVPEDGTDNGANWNIYTVDASVAMQASTSIAIDSNGKVHISYYDGVNYNLKYATNESGSWQVYTIADDYVGRYPSLAVDSDDNIHIVYQGGASLKRITNTTGTWQEDIVDSEGASYISLSIDSYDNIHISYASTNYMTDMVYLKYATNDTGEWIASSIDSILSSILPYGMNTSLAIDSENKGHISYFDYSNDDLKYATNGTDSWQIYTIESEGEVGQHCSIAVGSNGKVNIAFYDNNSGDLKYATNESGSWQSHIVDGDGNVGWFSSMAIDHSNKLHISYYDETNRDLKYATNKSGSWQIYTVDSEGDMGSFSSIAIDSSNKVHISYGAWSYPRIILKYATDL